MLDENKYHLGSICKREHEYNASGKGLRYLSNHCCVECSRAYSHEHGSTEKGKMTKKKYYGSKKGIKTNKEYRDSEAGRTAIRKYYSSEKSRGAQSKYSKSKKGRSAAKERRQSNKYKEWNHRQFTEHTQYAIGCTLRSHVRHALNHYSKTGKIMSSKKYGIDYGAIIKHLGLHPNNLGIKGEFHIDHIIPLSSFDLNDLEQIKIAFAPENHQWLTARENLVKSAKMPIDIKGAEYAY